jgi:hypothetical protein
MELPPGWDESWEKVGSTSKSDFFLDHERILLALPHPRSHGTVEVARENLDFLHRWFASHDDPPLLMIFFDRVASMDRAARKLYSGEATAAWALGFAIVGGTPLGRAVGSFFLGLSRTPAPIKLFPNMEEARAWLLGLPRAKPP